MKSVYLLLQSAGVFELALWWLLSAAVALGFWMWLADPMVAP